MGAPFKTGRECLSTRARVCTRYTEHGRASITRRRVPGCFIPFAIFHILPTRVRTHRWRCLGYPLLIPKPPATTPMPMQRHLWARGTSEPFTGQENPPLFAPWEAPCSGNPAFQPRSFAGSNDIYALRYFALLPLGEREVLLEEER